jgi:hypothetical protein
MSVLSAASRKAWETRKRMQIARGYGPEGNKRGTQAHKVKSVSEILAQLRASPNHAPGDPLSHSPLDCRANEAGGGMERKASAVAREPETTG